MTTEISLALAFISRLRSTIVTQWVWVMCFSHVWEGWKPHTRLFRVCVCCEPVHILERILKIPQEYKIQYTVVKVLHFNVWNTSPFQGRLVYTLMGLTNKIWKCGAGGTCITSDSTLGAFICRLLVPQLSSHCCILIFTMLPDLLASVKAFMQFSFPFKHLYS
jgi:hypothetical protein